MGSSLVAAAAVIAGFLWSLHRDMGNLRRDMGRLAERVAHIEGMLSGWRDLLREAVREAIDERDRRAAGAGDRLENQPATMR